MALTKRYVDVASTGGDGTTAATSGANAAFTWAQMITDLNDVGGRAGYKYLVKSGTYANATTSTSLTGDGTTTSPIVIEGYNSAEGDLYDQGRASGGALDTTNFPAISYTGTTARFDASGSTNLVIACLSITSAASNQTVQTGGAGCVFRRCAVSNTGTNSASSALLAGTDTVVANCDFITASTGAGSCVRVTASNVKIIGCRIKCEPGVGLLIRSTTLALFNTIYECTTGISIDHIASACVLMNNTIVNCTGDGIDVITGTTGQSIIMGNSITGCAYGIDFNTSTCVKVIGFNRLRDFTSSAVNGGGDWEEGTSVGNVTDDIGTTAANDAVDFTDYTTDDYSLNAGAPQTSKGLGYLIDIGAHGTPVVSGGGGSALHLGSLGQTGIGSF